MSAGAVAVVQAKQVSPRLSPGGKPMRRSQRVTLRMPIQAYARKAFGHAREFEEKTHLVRVSAHGGQMELEQAVARGDCFMLRHPSHTEEVECRVVSIARNPAFAKPLIGFEFTNSQIDFWRISFPAPGAKPILEKVR